MLQWSGGTTSGQIQLDEACSATIVDDELHVVRQATKGQYGQTVPRRTLFFRATAGGPSLQQWLDALTYASKHNSTNSLPRLPAVGGGCSDGGCCGAPAPAA